MSELPSLKSGNQNIINNNKYKIFAPIINKQPINNPYKAYNYLNMLQKYYKIQKPQINNNMHYYQVKNRISSGKKNIPNRILSPIKRNNVINIS